MFVIYKEIVKNSKLDQEAQRHKTDICSNSFWKQVKARPPPTTSIISRQTFNN